MNDVTNAERANVLLAMETSGDVCSVAVVRDGLLASEHAFRHGMRLSERLFEHVASVLHEADAVFEDVTAFAVGLGPGSFTGARVGVMTMKTLAAAQNRPIYGVSSLETLAAVYQGLKTVVIVPVLPSRSGVIIVGAYGVESDTPVSLRAPMTLPLDDVAAQLKEWNFAQVVLCGAGIAKYGADLELLLSRQGQRVSVSATAYPRASEVARLAHRRMASGDTGEDALALVPLYIAPPPISQPKPENRPPVYTGAS